jgi:hypothetical protein
MQLWHVTFATIVDSSKAILNKSTKPDNNQQRGNIILPVHGVMLLVVLGFHKWLTVRGTKRLVEPHFHMASL